MTPLSAIVTKRWCMPYAENPDITKNTFLSSRSNIKSQTTRRYYITVDREMGRNGTKRSWLLGTFPSKRKLTLLGGWQKNIKILVNLIFYQKAVMKTRLLYDTFVELFKHRFVHALQNPPLFSSDVNSRRHRT
jgi:hypothetical protein